MNILANLSSAFSDARFLAFWVPISFVSLVLVAAFALVFTSRRWANVSFLLLFQCLQGCYKQVLILCSMQTSNIAISYPNTTLTHMCLSIDSVW